MGEKRDTTGKRVRAKTAARQTLSLCQMPQAQSDGSDDSGSVVLREVSSGARIYVIAQHSDNNTIPAYNHFK